MLDEHAIPYMVREYTEEPLDDAELRSLLATLGQSAHELLRRHDPAFREHALMGTEDDDTLIPVLAAHPTLLQRPIGITASRAVVGRPPENLLALLEDV